MDKIYSYDDALQQSIKYFNGDELAANVFLDKYALRNNNNELLEATPTDMHWRLAQELADVEKHKFNDPLTAKEIFSYLDHFKYIVPQGSPMYGIGNPYKYVSLSNCFVVPPPEDSYGSILRADEHFVQICKRRGGVGTDISMLRPHGAFTNNASGSSTGIIPFVKRFSNTINEVGQHKRRGAGLISLSIHHPQVIDFAKCKVGNNDFSGVNISIRITNEFMSTLQNKSKYDQYVLDRNNNRKYERQESADKVWNAIIDSAHKSGDPGLMFWDTVTNTGPPDVYDEFRSVSSNPCGEQFLSAFDSCRLLLIPLYSFVQNTFTEYAKFDEEKFYKTVKIAQRLQDDIIDLELQSILKIIHKLTSEYGNCEVILREIAIWKEIYKSCANGRRTGTGITALADTLAALNIKYDSKEGIDYAKRLYNILKFAAYEESIEMARQLCPFPAYNADLEKHHPFFERFKTEHIDIKTTDNKIITLDGRQIIDNMHKNGRRNIGLLTTAPAGSVSLLTQTTSGLEPLFAYSYIRRKKADDNDSNVDAIDDKGIKWHHFEVFHPKLKEWMDKHPDTQPEESPWVLAENISWQNRVKMQGELQKHICNAISSTVNLPEGVDKQTISDIYLEAWKSGCKGITIYRQGSRDGILITPKTSLSQVKRPKSVPCDVHHLSVKGKQYMALVGLLNDQPYEVFVTKNNIVGRNVKKATIVKQRKNFYKVIFEDKDKTELSPITAATTDMEDAITRLVSSLLRSNIEMHLIVKQLEKVTGEMNGFAKTVARALKKYIPDGTKEKGELCPSCNTESLVRQEGCCICQNCGWSKC